MRDTEIEINALADCKNRTELAFEVKMLPMDVVLECLALREQRVSVDLVRDEVEAELNKVTNLFKNDPTVRNQLQQYYTRAVVGDPACLAQPD